MSYWVSGEPNGSGLCAWIGWVQNDLDNFLDDTGCSGSKKIVCDATAISNDYELEMMDAFQPTQSSILGYIEIGDEMHFELDVAIHSFPSSTWENFFVCSVLYNCLYSHLCSRCDSL